MKIIWITSLFPTYNSIVGIYLYRTVKVLSKYYNVNTVCIFPAVPPFLKMIEKPFVAIKTYNNWQKNFPKRPLPPNDIDKSSVYYTRYWRLPRVLFNHLEGYFAYLKTKKIIKTLITRDTILHSHWIFPSGQLARIIAKKHKIPYVVSLLGSDVHNLKYGTIYWYFAKKVLEDAKIICSVSHQLVEKCIKENIKIDMNKVVYIDNIYDENIFTMKDKYLIRNQIYDMAEKDKIILFAGNLVDIKNVDTLIKAFSEILKINQDCKLFIAGTGIKENYLKDLVKQLQLNGVKFLGNLFQEDLINYMNAADVFCLPSKNEGTPNVIIESLLCGTPVVASNVGGIPDVIKQGENGYLFNPLMVEELKNQLLESLNRNWDRQKIRNSVERFYNSEVIKEYHELYKRSVN